MGTKDCKQGSSPRCIPSYLYTHYVALLMVDDNLSSRQHLDTAFKKCTEMVQCHLAVNDRILFMCMIDFVILLYKNFYMSFVSIDSPKYMLYKVPMFEYAPSYTFRNRKLNAR